MSEINFYKNSLNSIRVLAAFNVFLGHFVGHYAHEWSEIALIAIITRLPNVPIFFTISGYLLYQSWLSNQEKEGTALFYLQTKFLRVLPSIWVSFVISIIMLIYLGVLDFRILFSVDFLIWSLTQLSFFQVYHPNFLRDYGVGVLNGSLWTIAVIFQYYFISIFIYNSLSYFQRKQLSNIFLIALISACLIIKLIIIKFSSGEDIISKILRVSIVNHLFFFVLGIFIRYYFDTLKELINFRSLFIVSVIGGGYFLLLYTKVLDQTDYSSLILSIVIIPIIFLGAYKLPNFLSLFKKYNLSYGFFIWHMIFINYFVEFGSNKNPIYIFLICLALVTLASYLQFYFLENKLYNFVYKKYLKKGKVKYNGITKHL